MFRNSIVLILLAAALGLGAWGSYRGSVMYSIKAAFVGSVFCPVRGQYPSVVSPEMQAEIQRKQESLRSRLAAYSVMFKVLSVASAAGCIASLFLLVARNVKRNVANDGAALPDDA